MSQKQELLLYLLIGALNINFATSERSNEDWPEDNTTPFSFPTPGPIDLKTSTARYLKTPTPLTFNSHKSRKSIAKNSGKDVVIEPNGNEKNEHAVITGGILYENVYKWFQTEFFWDLGMKLDAADKLDGVGSVVEVGVSYFNTKYGSKKNAISKRDGICQIIFFLYISDAPNKRFDQLQHYLEMIKEANSSTTIPEYLSFIWYHQNSTTDDYYAYPGMYLDPETGKIHYSSTVIILVRTPPLSISLSQFKNTFGSFLNKAKKPYSHILKAGPQGKRPVVHSKGFVSGKVQEKE